MFFDEKWEILNNSLNFLNRSDDLNINRSDDLNLNRSDDLNRSIESESDDFIGIELLENE